MWDVLSDQQGCDIVFDHWNDPAAAAAAIVRTALSSGSGDNLTAQVVIFGWQQEAGVVAAAARAEAKRREIAEAKNPAVKPKVEEEDVDMFA